MRVHLQRLKGKLFKEERENEKCSMDVLDRPFSVVWSIFGRSYLQRWWRTKRKPSGCCGVRRVGLQKRCCSTGTVTRASVLSLLSMLYADVSSPLRSHLASCYCKLRASSSSCFSRRHPVDLQVSPARMCANSFSWLLIPSMGRHHDLDLLSVCCQPLRFSSLACSS